MFQNILKSSNLTNYSKEVLLTCRNCFIAIIFIVFKGVSLEELSCILRRPTDCIVLFSCFKCIHVIYAVNKLNQ